MKHVQVADVDDSTILDSGSTGGGCLVADGHVCSGYYVTCPATLKDGRTVDLTAEHLYGEDGQFVRSVATVTGGPDDVEDAQGHGDAVRAWLKELREEYAAI